MKFCEYSEILGYFLLSHIARTEVTLNSIMALVRFISVSIYGSTGHKRYQLKKIKSHKLLQLLSVNDFT